MKLTGLLKDKQVQGWLIWLFLTLLLIAPCIYCMYLITYDTANTLTRILAGIFGAAMFSGVLTALGSEIWYRISLRKYESKKKEARKARRKKK
jgi:hypothetical protein